MTYTSAATSIFMALLSEILIHEKNQLRHLNMFISISGWPLWPLQTHNLVISLVSLCWHGLGCLCVFMCVCVGLTRPSADPHLPSDVLGLEMVEGGTPRRAQRRTLHVWRKIFIFFSHLCFWFLSFFTSTSVSQSSLPFKVFLLIIFNAHFLCFSLDQPLPWCLGSEVTL